MFSFYIKILHTWLYIFYTFVAKRESTVDSQRLMNNIKNHCHSELMRLYSYSALLTHLSVKRFIRPGSSILLY